ncbi:hypothetical protein NDA13_002010 [Ustilago tritici]|nr:hypothetical protein NDA13_002010 [Ustilago tritici]
MRTMSEASTRNVAAVSQPRTLQNEQHAEAGLSKTIHPKKPEKDSISDQCLAVWRDNSFLPTSALPRSKVRGTDKVVTQEMDIYNLLDIDDLELLRDLPLLGPPPQEPGGGTWFEPRPYWGTSYESGEFLSKGLNEHDTVPINPAVQANVERYHKLKSEGVHFNQVLMQNRSFKNPHVYSQLVNHLGIDETSSNLPSLDTGRYNGEWRSMFPFREEELIEGDPVAISKRQEKEHLGEKLAQLQANKDKMRSINFTRGSSGNNTTTSRRARNGAEAEWDEPVRPRRAANTGQSRPHASQSNGAGSSSAARPTLVLNNVHASASNPRILRSTRRP